MCGICGIIDYNKVSLTDAGLLKRMNQAMAHRGPDDEGIYLGGATPAVGLGHRRLSIIDLTAAGRQPMSNEDDTIWSVANAEIYNYKELRRELEGKGHRFKSHTDTETIIHLYEEHGKDCVKFLRGMFALAIWDEKNKSLLLARDRLGKKPLLYSYRDGKFCFASEFSALLASGLIKKEVRPQAIHHYLTFGYIPAPLTIYEQIFSLMPAHTLILKEGNFSLSQYWQLDYSRKLDISETQAQEELLRLLEESVKIRLYSDVPLGAFLSGGVDSSVVVALMSKLYNRRIETFSIGFAESAYNELDFARSIAKRFNTRHHELMVKPASVSLLPKLVEHYGQPYADSSCIPTYYVSEFTRKYVKVALNGDGADETFAGYERYLAVIISQRYQRMPVFIRKFLRSAIGALCSREEPKGTIKRLKRFFAAADLPLDERYFSWVGIFNRQQRERLISPEFKQQSVFEPREEFRAYLQDSSKLELLDRLLGTDTLTYLPGDLLVKVDIASMANALEMRSPFLDHKFMEFAASLPADYKLKNGVKKYILKKTFRGLLPQVNLRRRKMGFGVPVTKWLRNEMKDYLKDILLSPRCLKRGYFEPLAVKEMVEGHMSGRFDYGAQLWALLMLELWQQRFMD